MYSTFGKLTYNASIYNKVYHCTSPDHPILLILHYKTMTIRAKDRFLSIFNYYVRRQQKYFGLFCSKLPECLSFHKTLFN